MLILKDKRNGDLSAALMQIHGEPGVKTADVHYMAVPQNFSGNIFYTTLQGLFVNGNVYENGVITFASRRGNPADTKPTGPQVLTLPVNGDCGIRTIGIYQQTCYYSSSDVLQYCDPEILLFTQDITYCPQQGGGGGGGYDPPCPPGSSPIPGGNPNPPIIVEPLTINGKKAIRLVQGGDPGGGCVINVPDTTKFCDNVSPGQKQAIKNDLNTLKNADCISKVLYNILATAITNYCITSNASIQGGYNPATKGILIRDPSTVSTAVLLEEFFHAYQDKVITGGTAQYLGKLGSANIEFEAKVLRDITTNTNQVNGTGIGGTSAVVSNDYYPWLIAITNNFTRYPTSFTATQKAQYFNFMSAFVSQNPGYSTTSIDNSLNPTAIFSLINSSPCAH